MAFIHKIVGPDEKLVGIARLHWIYAVKGLTWLLGLMAFGVFVKFQLAGLLDGGLMPIGNAVFWIGTVLGAIFFLFYTVMMLTTELGLTTKRCIYKRGWLFVDVREVDLEEIKSSSVDNGILGRLLNYGYILMDARFIEDVGLPAVADPYRFTKAMNHIRSQIKDDTMRVVLDGGDPQAFSQKRKQREDVHNLSHDEYEALSDDYKENIKEITHADDDNETEGTDKKSYTKQQSHPNAKRTKQGDDSKSEDLETDPLKKTVKQHLKEEILEDFDEVDGESVNK